MWPTATLGSAPNIAASVTRPRASTTATSSEAACSRARATETAADPPGPMSPANGSLYEITPASEAREFGADVRVRVVRAGWFRPDAGGFFGVVPKPLWSRLVETDDRGRILCRLNLLLVEAGGKR